MYVLSSIQGGFIIGLLFLSSLIVYIDHLFTGAVLKALLSPALSVLVCVQLIVWLLYFACIQGIADDSDQDDDDEDT